MRWRTNLVMLLGITFLGGCASAPQAPPAVAALEIDPASRGPVSGLGIESRDIISMTDQMMRDMLTVPALAAAAKPPRVIIDSQYFVNDSSQPINKNTITDRLRVSLNRASQGRMTFVARNYADMVEREREVKRQGLADVGTTGLTKAQAGGDYRLGGRISSLDSRNPKTGMMQRYNQVVFEMIDLETGVIVWSGMYEFARAAADDPVYR